MKKMCSHFGPFGRPRRRWEDNIKMDLQQMGRGARTRLIWFRIETRGVNAEMNLRVP